MSSVKVEPINQTPPRIDFMKKFRQITSVHRPWEVWKDFITMFACSISNTVDRIHYKERENLYLRTIRRYNRDERFVFPELTALVVVALELNPEQDFLGSIFMELGFGNDAGGQFFTPYNVCKLMAEVSVADTVSKIEKNGYITMNDPTCGAGATLIAGINEVRYQLETIGLNFQNHVLVVAQDIDFITALMCYIQVSLLGVAAYVKVGNSLTEPICSSDTTDRYWFTPMYFSRVWVMRKIIRNDINMLFK